MERSRWQRCRNPFSNLAISPTPARHTQTYHLELPEGAKIGITMTAELADCFVTKREGVKFIVDSVTTALARFSPLFIKLPVAYALVRKPSSIGNKQQHPNGMQPLVTFIQLIRTTTPVLCSTLARRLPISSLSSKASLSSRTKTISTAFPMVN